MSVNYKFELADYTTIAPDETNVNVNIGDTVTPGKQLTGYDYVGYRVDGENIQTEDLELGAQHYQVKITFVYGKSPYSLEIKFVDLDGNPLKVSENESLDYTDSFTRTVDSIQDYSFAHWYLNDVNDPQSSDPIQFTMPHQNSVLTIVYFEDDGNTGVENLSYTKAWELEDGTPIATSLTPTIRAAVGDSVTADSLTGYVYEGYKINGNFTAGQPGFTLTRQYRGMEIVFVYSLASYELTIKYVDRDGNSILPVLQESGTPPVLVNLDYTQQYSATAPFANNYTELQWQLNGDTAQPLTPGGTIQFTMPHQDSTLTITYYADDGNTGTENLTYTKQYRLQSDDSEIKADAEVRAEVGDAITEGDEIAGYVYEGYKLVGDSAYTPGNPSITLTADDRDMVLTYGYSLRSYGLAIEYVDRYGNDITPDNASALQNASVSYTDTFSMAFEPAMGFKYVG